MKAVNIFSYLLAGNKLEEQVCFLDFYGKFTHTAPRYIWTNQTVSEVSPLMALLSLCCCGVTYLLLQRKNPGYVHFIAHKPGLSCRISAQSALFYGLLKKTVYSHSTNPVIWGCIFCAFANLLIFHLLFLAANFLSIKIVSQKAGRYNYISHLFPGYSAIENIPINWRPLIAKHISNLVLR